MSSLQYVPGTPLSSFIRCFWYAEGAAREHKWERLLPTGEVSIVFNLLQEPIRIYDSQDLTRYNTYGGAVLEGARDNSFIIDTDQQERVAGIQFLAGGAFPFLGMPVCEVEGASVALTDIWPRRTSGLREQMLAAPSAGSLFRILERFLLSRLNCAKDCHPAIAYAVKQFQRAGGGGRIIRVTEEVGLSARRFTELFHQQVGLTPKAFARVLRFQSVLQALRQQANPQWADLAAQCGFYDQAHFMREFKTFSGLTPTAYLQVSTPHLNHIPITSLQLSKSS